MLLRLADLIDAKGVTESQGWRAEAECRGDDPDRWFPGRGVDLSDLRAVCRDCPVKPECLEYALGHADSDGGVWASTSARQRRAIRRRGWSIDQALAWLDARGW